MAHYTVGALGKAVDTCFCGVNDGELYIHVRLAAEPQPNPGGVLNDATFFRHLSDLQKTFPY